MQNNLETDTCRDIFFRIKEQGKRLADDGKFATLVMDFYRGKVMLIWVLYLPVNKHAPKNKHTPKISIGGPCSLSLSENKHTCLFLELRFFCKFQYSETCSG